MNRRLAWYCAPLVGLILGTGCQSAHVPPAHANQPPAVVRTAPPEQPVANDPRPSANDPRPSANDPRPSANQSRPLVQVAILLDTSGSMDGLLEQAKAQLWKIVNEFNSATQNGAPPRLELALYEYGKSGAPAQAGFVRQICAFTTDLDRVSDKLFELRTNGGEEYCGWAVRSALRELSWSKDPKALKVIFIAGNEPFTQGPVAYQGVFAEARQRGILVNTIYCGNKSAGVTEGWQSGAVAGEGRYLVIDHNQAVAYEQAPQDQELARLSADLNKSYVAYGAEGGASLALQSKADQQAQALSPSIAAERAKVKGGPSFYSNASWDLVDAVTQKGVDVATLKAEELPAEMRGMGVADRKAYVAKKQAERQQLQARIQKLSAERDEYLASNAREQKGTLQSAVIEAVRTQAVSKGYVFKE